MQNTIKDPRVENYEWWHNAVFGPKPTQKAIPHKVLRAFLDYEYEVRQNNKTSVLYDEKTDLKRLKKPEPIH